MNNHTPLLLCPCSWRTVTEPLGTEGEPPRTFPGALEGFLTGSEVSSWVGTVTLITGLGVLRYTL